MSDFLKRIQEIDEKGIDSNDTFLDKSLEEYKEITNILKSFNSSIQNESFSGDLNKFNKDCSEFIEYIKKCGESSEISVLYMLRMENVIHYGKFNHGVRMDKNAIEMMGDEDLRKLYLLVQSEFVSDFVDGYKHTIGEGWSLNPTIGENVMIDISSDNSSDKNWFYEESHKEQKKQIIKEKIKITSKSIYLWYTLVS